MKKHQCWFDDFSNYFLDIKKVGISLFLGIIIFFILSFYIYIDDSVSFQSVVIDDKSILTVVSVEDLPFLLKKNKLILENKLYSYQIVDVEKEIQYQQGKYVKTVTLEVDLPKSYQISEVPFSFSINKGKRSIFSIIKSCLKGGM